MGYEIPITGWRDPITGDVCVTLNDAWDVQATRGLTHAVLE